MRHRLASAVTTAALATDLLASITLAALETALLLLLPRVPAADTVALIDDDGLAGVWRRVS